MKADIKKGDLITWQRRSIAEGHPAYKKGEFWVCLVLNVKCGCPNTLLLLWPDGEVMSPHGGIVELISRLDKRRGSQQ